MYLVSLTSKSTSTAHNKYYYEKITMEKVSRKPRWLLGLTLILLLERKIVGVNNMLITIDET